MPRVSLNKEKEGVPVADVEGLSGIDAEVLRKLEESRGFEAELLEGVDADRFAFEMRIFWMFAAMKTLIDKGEELFWVFNREAAKRLFDDEEKAHLGFMILGRRYSEYWDALSRENNPMELTRAFLKNVEAREAAVGPLFLYTINIFNKLKMIREMVLRTINDVRVEGGRIGII